MEELEEYKKRALQAEEEIAVLKKRLEALEKIQNTTPTTSATSQAKAPEQPEQQQLLEGKEESTAPKVAPSHISQQRVNELLQKEAPLTPDEKYDLLRSIGEECIQEEELRALLEKKPNPRCYDGFEPSGRMHIAQGILKALNVNKCTKAGCTFVFWVADWFALLNHKMDGDLKKIRVVGEYMIEVWKACGMDMDNVQFIWTSEEIKSNSNEYLLRVMDIARKFKLPRVLRCSQIMGRKDSDDLCASQIFYPCMQAADIFHLKADICQLGLDQRKVNMLAREYCDLVKPKIKFKPIILSHHMLMGLEEGQEKMSKSSPNSAIFMEDSPDDVRLKIKRCFCPPGKVEGNPCFDYLKHIVFQKFTEFTVARKEENGGDKTYRTYDEVCEDYVKELLHPGDLKPALTKVINQLLDPVRKHFETDPKAKALLAQVKKYRVTK